MSDQQTTQPEHQDLQPWHFKGHLARHYYHHMRAFKLLTEHGVRFETHYTKDTRGRQVLVISTPKDLPRWLRAELARIRKDAKPRLPATA